jgi:hypothetical protein
MTLLVDFEAKVTPKQQISVLSEEEQGFVVVFCLFLPCCLSEAE